MSKLMWIAGILLIAVSVALGLMIFVSPASVVGWGITPELVAVLLVGGLIELGLGSVIAGLAGLTPQQAAAPAEAPGAPIPEFGRKAADKAADVLTPAAAGHAAADVGAMERPPHDNIIHDTDVSVPTRETIEALEQARQKIEKAFEPKPAEGAETAAGAPEPPAQPAAVTGPAAARPAAEPVTAEQPAAEEEVAAEEPPVVEGQLYVVEERIIRMRPARILSDGTVEAETDEGWMRFENLEHLDEYLDAMAPGRG